MSIKKQYLKSKPTCKVTFAIDKKFSNNATNATLVGDFNNWDKQNTAMTKLKNGSFKVNLNLAADKEYQFRYLLDGKVWINDESADSYIPNNISNEDNSVVNLK